MGENLNLPQNPTASSGEKATPAPSPKNPDPEPASAPNSRTRHDADPVWNHNPRKHQHADPSARRHTRDNAASLPFPFTPHRTQLRDRLLDDLANTLFCDPILPPHIPERHHPTQPRRPSVHKHIPRTLIQPTCQRPGALGSLRMQEYLQRIKLRAVLVSMCGKPSGRAGALTATTITGTPRDNLADPDTMRHRQPAKRAVRNPTPLPTPLVDCPADRGHCPSPLPRCGDRGQPTPATCSAAIRSCSCRTASLRVNPSSNRDTNSKTSSASNRVFNATPFRRITRARVGPLGHDAVLAIPSTATTSPVRSITTNGSSEITSFLRNKEASNI